MLTVVLVSFAVIGLGWFARRFGVVGADADKPFNDYLYYVSMPALILDKLTAHPLAGSEGALIAANMAPVLALMFVILALWKAGAIGAKLTGELLITSVFGNTVYLGFPVVSMRLGEAALAQAAVIGSVQNLVVFTFGFGFVAWVTGRKDPNYSRDLLLKNSLLWSSIVGAFLSISGFRVPALLSDFLSLVGSGTAPLALFTLGLFLYGKRIGTKPVEVAVLCAFKLLLFPALVAAAALALGLRGLDGRVSLLEAMMPLAVTNFVIAQKLSMDEGLVAEAILASTLAALPLLLAFDSLAAFF